MYDTTSQKNALTVRLIQDVLVAMDIYGESWGGNDVKYTTIKLFNIRSGGGSHRLEVARGQFICTQIP